MMVSVRLAACGGLEIRPSISALIPPSGRMNNSPQVTSPLHTTT